MKARRRFWSLLLAVCMILTFMPTAAFAEEDSGAQEPETKVSIPEGSATTQGESSVAEVSLDGANYYFDTLEAAVSAISENNEGAVTITLVKDTAEAVLIGNRTLILE